MRWRDLLQLNQKHPIPTDYFARPRRVHFTGIGGIGMSALAFLLQARGHQVSGSDAADSPLLQKLREAGITIFIGQNAENLDVLPAESLIWSSAIADTNPEMKAARKKTIPTWHRAQLLAHFVNSAETSIAVSGTHGKSTTSAMIAHVLTETDLNPTAILGAIYPPFESNFRLGDPDLIVVEADESDGSFTLLKPSVAVVLNVEPEHLENYDESEEELWKAFEMFVDNAEFSVIHEEWDEESGEDEVDFEADLWRLIGRKGIHDQTTFSTLESLQLPIPGAHNRSNASAAIKVAQVLEESPHAAAHAIKSFAGILRRFEKKGEAQNILVYDDYGHHPTEVKATLGAAKEFLERPIVVVFQPHRYSRTQHLHREFGPAFEAADTIIITQLYSAYEEPIEGVSGRLVFDAVRENFPEKPIFYAENLDEARQIALEQLKSGDALLTMGAGDITKLGSQILQSLEEKYGGA